MSDIKITFDDLQSALQNNNYQKLYRSKQDKIIYDEYLKYIKNEWYSSSDIILADVFGFNINIDNNGRKYVNKSILNEQKIIYKVMENKFPYNFDNNIVHYLIWILNGTVTQTLLDIGLETIQKQHPHKLIKNHVHWINPPIAKSILDVEHAHIVVEFE